VVEAVPLSGIAFWKCRIALGVPAVFVAPRPGLSGYGRPMRSHDSVGALEGLLDEPLVAVLATLRRDATVLLSPVWHEWRDGGFNLWVEADNAKARHLRRDPRATIVVAESTAPLRGIEVRGTARFVEHDVSAVARRIAARYVPAGDAAAYTQSLSGADVIVRLEPGTLRIWDFADDWPA
jgi:PPOX class probable F420-dependent enzyme